MVKLSLIIITACGMLLPFGAEAQEGSQHYLGVGAHYWTAIDDIDTDNVDENGFAWLITYQLQPAALLKLEINLEILPDGFRGADDQMLAPELYLLLGSVIYAGAGIGVYYVNSDFSDEPFYAFRAGLDLELIPRIHIDINGNYRFENWDNLRGEDIDTDTVTLGAAVRFEL